MAWTNTKKPIGHRQPSELIFLPADNLESKRWSNLTETSSAGRLAPGLRSLFSCTTSSIAIISMCSGFECRPELGRKCFAKLKSIFQTCKFLTFFFFTSAALRHRLCQPPRPSRPLSLGLFLKSECKGRHFFNNHQIFTTLFSRKKLNKNPENRPISLLEKLSEFAPRLTR